MRSIVVALLAPALLAACATPFDRCVKRNSATFLHLETRILTVQGNIDRGYAIHTKTVPETVWDRCPRYNNGKIIGYHLCPDTYYRTVETPVPISVPEERRKLIALEKQRDSLVPRHREVTAQCRAAHPDPA